MHLAIQALSLAVLYRHATETNNNVIVDEGAEIQKVLGNCWR